MAMLLLEVRTHVLLYLSLSLSLTLCVHADVFMFWTILSAFL